MFRIFIGGDLDVFPHKNHYTKGKSTVTPFRRKLVKVAQKRGTNIVEDYEVRKKFGGSRSKGI